MGKTDRAIQNYMGHKNIQHTVFMRSCLRIGSTASGRTEHNWDYDVDAATMNVLNRENLTFLHMQEVRHAGFLIGDYRPEHVIR